MGLIVTMLRLLLLCTHAAKIGLRVSSRMVHDNGGYLFILSHGEAVACDFYGTDRFVSGSIYLHFTCDLQRGD